MYCVLDVETTGTGKNDRIVELALIGLDQFGEKQWEWCSLINPERDTVSGMVVKIHQIYSRDVENVPRKFGVRKFGVSVKTHFNDQDILVND